MSTVTINGVKYDAATGMRLSEAPSKKPAPKLVRKSQDIHGRTQRTKTLRNRTTKSGKRSTLLSATETNDAPVKQPVSRSPHITKFAKSHHAAPAAKRVISDIGPRSHPAQAAHSAKKATTKPANVPPANVVKSKAITDAVATATKKKPKAKKSFFKRKPNVSLSIAALIAVIGIAGYFTYTNLPSLSVQIASAQAGIDAGFPSYQPSGYSVSGPVAFSEGEVAIKFKSNGGPHTFTLTQTKSNWDSSALLDNYVVHQSNDQYSTYNDSGLTIYIFNTNAAWINGGVMHILSGDAPLTQEQLRRIATSV